MPAVSVFNAHPRYRVRKLPVANAVHSVLRGERRTRTSVAVVLIDTPFCVRMNRRFLGHHYSTDVLTFPLGDRANPEGEIYVNLDKAREQADLYGVSFFNELTRLVVHGTLHLAGYDDRRRTEAARMKRREDAYVQKLMAGRPKGKHERKSG